MNHTLACNLIKPYLVELHALINIHVHNMVDKPGGGPGTGGIPAGGRLYVCGPAAV